MKQDLLKEMETGSKNALLKKRIITHHIYNGSTTITDLAKELDATVVVKGLRAITDFEYEFQMTAMNYQLSPQLETLFIMSPPQYMYLSSSIVREISKMGGDIKQFVPPCVYEALKKKYANLK